MKLSLKNDSFFNRTCLTHLIFLDTFWKILKFNFLKENCFTKKLSGQNRSSSNFQLIWKLDRYFCINDRIFSWLIAWNIFSNFERDIDWYRCNYTWNIFGVVFFFVEITRMFLWLTDDKRYFYSEGSKTK